MNPIFARDLRSYWRHWSVFALMLLYGVLLAVMMALFYADALLMESTGLNPNDRMAAVGHRIFAISTAMQAALWMLIGPALTATTIAGERESGLLEAIQLSPLSPWQIIGGKLFSTLAFIAVLLIVPLPITAVCFLMGGVSPGDFCLATLLHAATATTCAAIGLWCSARSRRAHGALGAAFALVLLWGLGSLVAVGAAQALAWRAPGTAAPPLLMEITSLFNLSFGYTNPIIAAISLSQPTWGALPLTVMGIALDAWMVSLIWQGFLTLTLLWSAMRAVRRPLTDDPRLERRARRSERRRLKKLQRAQSQKLAQSAAQRASPAPSSAMQPLSTPAAERDDARRALPSAFIDLELPPFMRFSNPVLERELRSKLRWRRQTFRTAAWMLALGLSATALYAAGTFMLGHNFSRYGVWSLLVPLGVFVLILAAGVMGATAFAREREARTWEGIRLSLLSPREIVAGKLLAPLLACLLYSLPLWPLLLLCVRWEAPFDAAMPEVEPYGYTRLPDSVPLSQVVATILVAGATAWCYIAWGLLMSWLFRRTTAAVVCALASVFLALAVVPIYLDYFNLRGRWDTFVALWHPLFALGDIGPGALWRGLLCALTLSGLGFCWLALLLAAMRRGVTADWLFETADKPKQKVKGQKANGTAV